MIRKKDFKIQMIHNKNDELIKFESIKLIKLEGGIMIPLLLNQNLIFSS
jgi:hypothetical protein